MKRNINKWLGIALSLLIVCSCEVFNSTTVTNNDNNKDTVVNPEVDRTVSIETVSGNGYVIDNDKDTTINPRILLKFSKEIDITNLSSGILLVSADNPNQKIDLTYNTDGNNVLVSPKLPLAISTDYILQITQKLKVLETKKLIPDKSFKFSTGDDNKLIVSLISPMGVVKELESVKIQLYFSHPIVDFKELPTDAIIITNSIDRTDTVTVDSIKPDPSLDPHIINILIKNKLKRNSTYKIMITSKIHDQQKSPILNSEALRFKTRNNIMISCSFICKLTECEHSDNSSIMMSFKPDITIKCNFPDGLTVHPSAEELLKHISFTHVDEHGYATDVNIYALQKQDQDGIYRFSSTDTLDDNIKYYLQIFSFKINDDQMIVNSIANPFNIVKSIDNKSPNLHNHAIDMQTTNDNKIFVFGGSKYNQALDKSQSAFIDQYDDKLKLVQSIDIEEVPPFFLNLQAGLYKNNIVYLLLQTNLDAGLLPGLVKNYVEKRDMIDPQVPIKLPAIEPISSDKITTQRINSTSVDGVKDSTYVLSEVNFKKGTEPQIGCMVTFYSDNSSPPHSVIILDKKYDGPDSKISCDKIITTTTVYDHNRMIQQELLIAHHSISYRAFDVFTYYILDDENNPANVANSISLKSSKYFTSYRGYWDDMPLAMFHPNPTGTQNYVYMVAAAKPDLKIYKCDLNANPVPPYNTISCDDGYNIGSRISSVSSFSVDNDQHYLMNYRYYTSDYLDDANFGAYKLPYGGNTSQLVRYLHSDLGYNYVLWNYPDNYQLFRL